MVDVAIAGLGPAGRSLATACARRGLSVLALDARPADAAWRPTYGLWADQLGALPDSVVRSRVDSPALRALGDHRIHRSYVLLDNAALQTALPLDGVEVRHQRVTDADLTALRRTAGVVVDARGARPDGRRPGDPTTAQHAYGIVVDADAAAGALGGTDGVLMDWRPLWAEDPDRPTGVPTFLYALPLGDGRVLLEETCLASAPGLGMEELAARLRRRLARLDTDPGLVDRPLDREVVRIPMRGRGRPAPRGIATVGTAGRGGHIVTGYSVAHSLATADDLAAAIASGRTPRSPVRHTPAEALRELGLRAVLNLDVPGTLELFDAFGRLPAAQQADYLSRDTSATALARAMWGMFAHMAPAGRAALAWASLLPRVRRPGR